MTLLRAMVKGLRPDPVFDPNEYIVDFSTADDLNLPSLLAEKNIIAVSRIPTSGYPQGTIIFVTGIKRFYVMHNKNWIQYDERV